MTTEQKTLPKWILIVSGFFALMELPMFTLAYIFFLVMFVGDLFIGLSQNENSLVITAIVMCIISSAMLLVINRRK